ncbi:pentapeptide repeat-containing protein [Allobacillus halotolerans]|uniref:Pentapeptide repeat-containing protein n=1 Tax=Allobacillus halotolerans TaxID=570278 RepID=A0ABS6GQ76_9BACI|nr:pentapeptide repeat-containing protein [Allobacillus halotolerans]MBU6081269.1 pentapeptide repeat-containing protein [Allobacillus halotolerans]
MRNKDRRIEQPDLPEKLDQRELTTIEEHSLIETAQIRSIAGPVTANHVRFREVHLKGIHFDEVNLPSSSWVDVIFENCDLSNIEMNEARMNRVEFRNCKLAGTNFDRAELQDVRFVNCQAPYALFNLAKMYDVRFNDCLLKSANFIDANFSNVQFGKSIMDDVQFTGTSLKNVDLSECELRQIHVEKEDLQGAIVSADQAVSLIELFGVHVKDD